MSEATLGIYFGTAIAYTSFNCGAYEALKFCRGVRVYNEAFCISIGLFSSYAALHCFRDSETLFDESARRASFMALIFLSAMGDSRNVSRPSKRVLISVAKGFFSTLIIDYISLNFFRRHRCDHFSSFLLMPYLAYMTSRYYKDFSAPSRGYKQI